MRVTTTKSKNSESFYITKSFKNSKGKSTSTTVRKLGMLSEWLKEQAERSVQITFHADRRLDFGQQKLYCGGYLFLQYIYYGLQLDKTCRKIRDKYDFKFDINAILSDLIYNRVLAPTSKCSAFKMAQDFLEPPTYEPHDVYRALSILAKESDLIQADCYKNSSFLYSRDPRILYYDCSNFYFEIGQEDGKKKYGKSIAQIRLYRWDFLWIGTESPLHSPFSQEMKMNSLPLNHLKPRAYNRWAAINLYTAVMPVLLPRLTEGLTILLTGHLLSHNQ